VDFDEKFENILKIICRFLLLFLFPDFLSVQKNITDSKRNPENHHQ